MDKKDMVYCGSRSETGQKKAIDIGLFLLKKKNYRYLGRVLGFMIGTLLITIFYQQNKYKTWLKGSYGDLVLDRARMFLYSYRYVLKNLRFAMLDYNIISPDILIKRKATIDKNSGKFIQINLEIYSKDVFCAFVNRIFCKRDKKLDFLYPGINSYEYYYF